MAAAQESKERQRWQPEEDALLLEYVKRYGPKDWGSVSERMGRPLHRDPKSCHERWKNYLHPGLKKGSLSPDEQSLLISLQAHYGNKWKAIAAHLPGRTPKRLGKWWEVFKEKQHKKLSSSSSSSAAASAEPPHNPQSAYDHILQTFAEKHVLPAGYCSSPDPHSSSSTTTAATFSPSPPPPLPLPPSVALSLSPPPPPSVPTHYVPALVHLCEEVEEGRRAWAQHRKEAAWRLSRLEKQMEAEKARKKREKLEEVEKRMRKLDEEEREWMERLEEEWRGKAEDARRAADVEEERAAEAIFQKQAKLAAAVERMVAGAAASVRSCGGGDDGQGRNFYLC